MSVTPRRRWFTFGLRTFLVAVTALAIWLALWTNKAHQQRMGLAAIRQALLDAGKDESGWHYCYDFGVIPLKNANASGYPFSDAGIAIDYNAVPAEREWVLNLLGVDFFHNVVAVNLPSGINADSALADVGRFRRLQHLVVETGSEGNAPSDASIACLASLEHLKSLVIKDCSAETDDSLRVIGGLHELERLYLWGGSFTDDGLAHLKGLSRLKRLVIGDYVSDDRDIRVTDAGLANIADLVDLEQLYIDSPYLTGEGLKHLAKLQKLVWLQFSSPLITDDGLRYLADLSSLRRIEFLGTGIDGSGFKHLRNHQKLKALNLDSTRLNDEGLAQIVRLPALESLLVRNTEVTAAGLEQLRYSPRLKSLYTGGVLGDIDHLKDVLVRSKIVVSD